MYPAFRSKFFGLLSGYKRDKALFPPLFCGLWFCLYFFWGILGSKWQRSKNVWSSFRVRSGTWIWAIAVNILVRVQLFCYFLVVFFLLFKCCGFSMILFPMSCIYRLFSSAFALWSLHLLPFCLSPFLTPEESWKYKSILMLGLWNLACSILEHKH